MGVRHILLRPAQTRWFSLVEVVRRINEYWRPLIPFFISKKIDAQLIAAETILNQLQDPQVKIFCALCGF